MNLKNKEIIDCIKTYPHNRRNGQVQIMSKSDFFDDYLIIKHDNEKITFRKITLDYQGKTQKPSYDKKQKHFILTVICEIPSGTFYFDEVESNEDYKVIYFKDNNKDIAHGTAN